MDSEMILSKARAYVDAEKNELFRKEISALLEANDMEALNERFYSDLAFGTGGLRGIIGGGSNRINSYNIKKATQGVANYILKAVDKQSASAVIAYDSRRFSDLFALEAARVLCGNGIKTWLFTSLRPTPELSFAVRHLGATAGIVVTASHNPPEYNGYKVYWSDGGQVIPPHDVGIVKEANSVSEIVDMDDEKAREQGLLLMIDKQVDEPFIEMIKGLALRPDLIREKGKDLTVVFTPLHGTGAMPVSRALGEMGIDVTFVEEQKEPDGDFPTVEFPNPEEASAMKMALDLAKKIDADLVMGTDPDADRLGIAVPVKGEYRLVSGNQLGALLADYIFSTRKELGTLPAKPAFVKTIVTTELQTRIARSYGAICFDTLTGFKYIGEKIRQFEEEGGELEYVFGGEESYGYLLETQTRDKDAVSAATMTAEMALYHSSQGKTIFDRLNEIYEKYGYFEEKLISKYFKGSAGNQIMKDLMAKLRNDPPAQIGEEQTVLIRDYKTGMVRNLRDQTSERSINLPSSNVLQFVLSEGSIVTARPSGTEPKIKFYASCGTNPGMSLGEAKNLIQKRIGALEKSLRQMIGD